MTTAGLAVMLLAALDGSTAQAGDVDAVKAVVRAAYVEGVHASFDPATMRRGFHPDFRMLVLKDGAMQAVGLEQWIERLAQRKAPDGMKPKIEGDFTYVDVTNEAATVRLELKRDGRHVFTDYLSLYLFPDGWRIVSKTFRAHP